MDAKAKSFSFLAHEGAVVVPFFQRPYVWDENNWSDLLDDLLDNSTSHFLGSIILKQLPRQSGEINKVSIIDGQQRLTTLSVLLRAIYDSMDDNEKNNSWPQINPCLFYKTDYMSNDLFVKIKHSKTDSRYYELVIKGECLASNIPIENNIIKCYKYYLQRLSKITKNDCGKLLNLLLHPDNKLLVVIDLTNDDNEQNIFDTINSAGVRLSSADIIKNALFQKALELHEKDESKIIALHSKYWEDIFFANNEVIAYWSTERTLGRIKRDNLEILLHSIAIIEGFFDPEKHTLSDITNVYKDYFNTFDKNKLMEFLNILENYSTLYKEKMLIFSPTDEFVYDDPERRLFKILDICEISTFNPYILYLYKKYEEDRTKLLELLYELEVYVVRRFICNLTAKNYNKVCKECIDDENKLKVLLKESEMSDTNFGLALKKLNKGNTQGKLVLFWIELYRRFNGKFDITKLAYKYTLEHIMPQKWEEHWASVPIIGDNDQVISDPDQAKTYRYEMIYNIGNMTLLNQPLNAVISNYDIYRKIYGEGRYNCIKKCSDLSLTKEIIATYENPNIQKWDETTIRERYIQLKNDAIALWHL